jgi:sec-independent protein translocase protein TatB
MFEIGWTEILVIAVVAIVVFPSKDLPKLLRSTGQMVGKVRKMAGEFQGQFNAALREAEREIDLEETRQKVEDIKNLNPVSQVKQALNPLAAPLADVRKSVESMGEPPVKAGTGSTTAPATPGPATGSTEPAAPMPPPSIDPPPPSVTPPAGNPTLAPVGVLAKPAATEPAAEPAPKPKRARTPAKPKAAPSAAVDAAPAPKRSRPAKSATPPDGESA